MLMDITAPLELLRLEQADFGDGRRVAYLTFLSEGEKPITEIAGRLTLRDGSGKSVGHRIIAFDGLMAHPRERFTCHLTLDDYPPFEGADFSPEYAAFLGDEPWALNPRHLMDATPPALPPGPDRVALVAVTGRDAICFPHREEALWICVCGRFNRDNRPNQGRRYNRSGRDGRAFCQRCNREREQVFATLTRERVIESYRLMRQDLKAIQDSPPQTQRLDPAAAKRSKGAKGRRKAMPAKAATPRQPSPMAAKPLPRSLRAMLAAILSLLFVTALAFGAMRLLSARSTPYTKGMDLPAVDIIKPI